MHALKSTLLALAIATASASALAQAAGERVIRFGHLNNTDHPVSLGVKKFAEIARRQERRQDEGQGIPGLAARQRDAAAVGAAGRRAGDVGAGDDVAGRHRQGIRPDRLPVLGRQLRAGRRSCSTARSARRSSRKLPEKGLVALGFWDLGFRNVTNSKRPITKAEDLDGLKLRVIPNPVFLETFKAFKANPVPMPFAELYGALETQGGRRPGEPVLGDPLEQVLRGAEVRQRDQPRLRRQHRPGQQEVLGQARRRPSRR